MLNGLDLFSGIGGIACGLRDIVAPVAYCENDRYAQAVLMSRMSAGEIYTAPIWDDVRTLRGEILPAVDIITGGFPCQDISCAGSGRGLEGERSGLVFEIIRLCRDIRPTYVFLENVPAITIRGLERVLLEFTEIGYDSRWTVVSAAELGAPHLRERWFCLCADTERLRGRESADTFETTQKPLRTAERQEGSSWVGSMGENVSDAARGLRDRTQISRSKRRPESANRDWWKIEPSVGRVVDGIQNRMDRLRGLGNACVPAQAREAFMRLSGLCFPCGNPSEGKK